MTETIIPNNMQEVTKEQFFKLLAENPQDIMPSHKEPYVTTWETKSRQIWGMTLPGWKNPSDKKMYAVTK